MTEPLIGSLSYFIVCFEQWIDFDHNSSLSVSDCRLSTVCFLHFLNCSFVAYSDVSGVDFIVGGGVGWGEPAGKSE